MKVSTFPDALDIQQEAREAINGAISFTDLTAQQQEQLLSGHEYRLSDDEINAIFTAAQLAFVPVNQNGG